jgi:hypothetical protein
MIRQDYIPSNWILVWYLLYMFGIVQNNPLFALQVGIAVNSSMIVFMLFSNASTYNILFLLVAGFLFKVIPWFTIRNTTLKTSDVVASVGLAFIYVGWILWQNKTTMMVNRFLTCLNLKK